MPKNIQLFPKLVLIAFVSAFSQQSYAVRCVGYVSINGGEPTCAAWEDTFSCEKSIGNCLPTNPPRTSTGSTDTDNVGRPGRGVSPRDPMTLDEMSCKQLDAQITKQQAIIDRLNQSREEVLEAFRNAKQTLDGPLSEDAVMAAKNAAFSACSETLDIESERECIERPRKPPLCRPSTPKPKQKAAIEECNRKNASRDSLINKRNEFLKAMQTNERKAQGLYEKRERAVMNFHDLKAAKDAKVGSCR